MSRGGFDLALGIVKIIFNFVSNSPSLVAEITYSFSDLQVTYLLAPRRGTLSDSVALSRAIASNSWPRDWVLIMTACSVEAFIDPRWAQCRLGSRLLESEVIECAITQQPEGPSGPVEVTLLLLANTPQRQDTDWLTRNSPLLKWDIVARNYYFVDTPSRCAFHSNFKTFELKDLAVIRNPFCLLQNPPVYCISSLS